MLTKTWASVIVLGFALLLAVWSASGLVSRGTESEDVAAIRLIPTGNSTSRVPAEVADTPADHSAGRHDGGTAGPFGGTGDDGAPADAPRDKGDGVDTSSPDLSPAGGNKGRRGDEDTRDRSGGNRDSDRSSDRGGDDDQEDDQEDDDDDD